MNNENMFKNYEILEILIIIKKLSKEIQIYG